MGLSPSCRLLGLVGKNFPLVFACLISRLFGFSPSYLPGVMGLSPRCRLSGLVGKICPPCLCVPHFKAFGFSPSYLPGLMGLSPSCRLLGLVGKIFPPLSLRASFQGFWILTLISTLGSWGYPPVVDFWDLWAKFSSPCLCVPHFKAFGFSPSYLPGLMGLSPSCRLLGLVGKIFPPLSLRASFQGFWILTLISTLGSWGYPLVVDFWDLLAKMCVFLFYLLRVLPQ